MLLVTGKLLENHMFTFRSRENHSYYFVCRNFTNVTFPQNETKPVLSYLKDDSPGKASLDSSVISVLASIGFVGIFAFVIGFVVIRRRTLENTDGSFVNVVTGPLRQTRSKSNEIEESKGEFSCFLLESKRGDLT